MIRNIFRIDGILRKSLYRRGIIHNPLHDGCQMFHTVFLKRVTIETVFHKFAHTLHIGNDDRGARGKGIQENQGAVFIPPGRNHEDIEFREAGRQLFAGEGAAKCYMVDSVEERRNNSSI